MEFKDLGSSIVCGRKSQVWMRSKVMELSVGQPESAMARSNSRRIISRTCLTPDSPPEASPHNTGRPMKVARAP